MTHSTDIAVYTNLSLDTHESDTLTLHSQQNASTPIIGSAGISVGQVVSDVYNYNNTVLEHGPDGTCRK